MKMTGLPKGAKVLGCFHHKDEKELNGESLFVAIKIEGVKRLTVYSPIGQHSEVDPEYLEECEQVDLETYLKHTSGLYTPACYLESDTYKPKLKQRRKERWKMGDEKREMENLNIDIEPIDVEPYSFTVEPLHIMGILNQPVDATLDLYNDYRTLYNITKDDKFLVRSHDILNLLKHKLREESKTK